MGGRRLGRGRESAHRLTGDTPHLLRGATGTVVKGAERSNLFSCRFQPPRGGENQTLVLLDDSDTGTTLYHTGINDEAPTPFFPDVGAAEAYLEQRAKTDDREPYETYSLYETKMARGGEAVDVLTDQAGIEDVLAQTK